METFVSLLLEFMNIFMIFCISGTAEAPMKREYMNC